MGLAPRAVLPAAPRPPGSARGREAGRRAPSSWAGGREEEEERKVCTGRSRLQPARSPRRKPQGSEPAALGACEPAQPLLPQGPALPGAGRQQWGPSGCHPASRSVGCGRQELGCKVRVNYTLSINGRGVGGCHTHTGAAAQWNGNDHTRFTGKTPRGQGSGGEWQTLESLKSSSMAFPCLETPPFSPAHCCPHPWISVCWVNAKVMFKRQVFGELNK